MDIGKKIPPKPPVYKKRRIWVTVVLTILGPGLPLVYCGYLKAGLLIEVGATLFIFTLLILQGLVPYLPTTILFFFGVMLLFISFLILNIRFTLISNRLRRLRIKNAWVWIVGIIVVTGAIDYIITSIIESNVVEAYKIPSSSMEPTLIPGDFLMATKGIDAGKLHYGDLVIFKYPLDQDQNYIERLVARGGDIIKIVDKQVYRNGEELTEPYIQHAETLIFPGSDRGRWGRNMRDNMAEIEVPQGKLFVLGDNRDNSADSRFWGFLDEGLVTGKARFIHFSWDSENNRVRWERLGMRLDQ